MDNSTKSKLEDIINRARTCSNKGRLYVYEQFKQELQELSLTPYQFEQACITIARHLEV